jgi:hypothetical protein
VDPSTDEVMPRMKLRIRPRHVQQIAHRSQRDVSGDIVADIARPSLDGVEHHLPGRSPDLFDDAPQRAGRELPHEQATEIGVPCPVGDGQHAARGRVPPGQEGV